MKKNYKFLVLLSTIVVLSFKLVAQTDLITFTWTVSDPAEMKAFYLMATPDESFDVNWGDTSFDNEQGDMNLMKLSHKYNSGGDYTVTISTISTDCRFTWLLLDKGKVTSLDVSGAAALTHLGCYNNEFAITGSNITLTPSLTSLLLNNNNSASLPAFSTCPLLTVFWCEYNQLTGTLDLSSNTNLTDLRCHGNQLTDLDLTSNSALVQLWCSDNLLTNLDLSANTNLELLYCYVNQFDLANGLDLGANTLLTHLYCYDNLLHALDLTNNPDLKHLWCSNTELDSLDVTNETNLEMLYCYDNHLLLSDLYKDHLMVGLKANKYLGTQSIDSMMVYVGFPLSFGSIAQNLFNGQETDFYVEENATPRTKGIHYDVTNGVITFLVPGDYAVVMTNNAIVSDDKYPAQDVFIVTARNYIAVLDLKVFLQGAIDISKPYPVMKNSIQEPLVPFFTELELPEDNPYELPGSYARINDTTGPAKQVVDWIWVEIWSNVDMSSPMFAFTYELVASRALLLQPDGSVVDTNGLKPEFEPYTEGAVRIVVNHRNHLSVLGSEDLAFLPGEVSYDFTDNVNKAYKFSFASEHAMVASEETKHAACLWAGDINMDHFINYIDVITFEMGVTANVSGKYLLTDVNMDGIVNHMDGAYFQYNSSRGLYSPLPYFTRTN